MQLKQQIWRAAATNWTLSSLNCETEQFLTDQSPSFLLNSYMNGGQLSKTSTVICDELQDWLCVFQIWLYDSVYN